MGIRFISLLRSNFRCGRMLCSRTVSVAGRFGAPGTSPPVQAGSFGHTQSGRQLFRAFLRP